jgi:site-specific DNA recombinase
VGSNNADPSLLAGLVFDDQGNHLTPTHTKKGSTRYRYYVAHALIAAGRKAAPQGVRIPAKDMEDVVLGAIGGFLTDESSLINLMGKIEADVARSQLKRAAGLAKQLSEAQSSDRIEILKRLVARITVSKESLVIVLHTGAAWSLNDAPDADSPSTAIEVPVQLKRCGMAVRMIVRTPGKAANRRPDPKLIALISKAHTWFEKLTSGRYDSIKAIAQDEKVTPSYVTHVIYLAFLDPGIVQRILSGDHPLELSADRLIRMVPLPESWVEQRKLLGMNS